MTDKVQWKTLPTKANRDMEQAGADAAREYLERTGSNNLWVIYEAMTAAAPAAPVDQLPRAPVTLPTCKANLSSSHDWDQGYSDGWKACLEEITKLGPLYTHADSVAVERLRADVELAESETMAAMSELAECAEMTAMVAEREWAEHIGTGDTSSKVEAALTQLQNERGELSAQLTKARHLLHTASVHLSRWVDMDAAPRQQIIEYLEGTDKPIERDERAAFERYYVDWFNRKYSPSEPLTIESMLAARRGDNYGYGSLGRNGKWEGWQARASLERQS